MKMQLNNITVLLAACALFPVLIVTRKGTLELRSTVQCNSITVTMKVNYRHKS